VRILACTLPVQTVEQIATQIDEGDFQVDLNLKQIKTPYGDILPFAIDAWRRESLLKGLDSIELGLTYRDKIKEFQRKDKVLRPWVYASRASM